MPHHARLEFQMRRRRSCSNQRIIPGMPVEAFIKQAERTVLSYPTKPLVDQMMRAFREAQVRFFLHRGRGSTINTAR